MFPEPTGPRMDGFFLNLLEAEYIDIGVRRVNISRHKWHLALFTNDTKNEEKN